MRQEWKQECHHSNKQKFLIQGWQFLWKPENARSLRIISQIRRSWVRNSSQRQSQIAKNVADAYSTELINVKILNGVHKNKGVFYQMWADIQVGRVEREAVVDEGVGQPVERDETKVPAGNWNVPFLEIVILPRSTYIFTPFDSSWSKQNLYWVPNIGHRELLIILICQRFHSFGLSVSGW